MPKPTQTPRERIGSLVVVAAVLGLIAVNVWYVLDRDGVPQHAAQGEPAPGFVLPRLAAANPTPADPQSAQVSLDALRGQVVVMDFWATWCGSCARGLPELEALHRQTDPARVAVLTINNEGPDVPPDVARQQVRRFIDARQLTLPVLMDHSGSVFQAYGVRSIPRTVIVAPDGTIAHIHTGPVSRDLLQRQVEGLLP